MHLTAPSATSKEVRESDLMNELLPRWPAPHSMEPETPKTVGSQWLSSFLNGLLFYYVQEDGMWQCSLISEMETSMKWEESSLSVESLLDAAACHTFRCM